MQKRKTTYHTYKIPLIVGVLFSFFFIVSCTKNNTCLSPKVVALRGGFYYRGDSANAYKDSVLVNANIFFGAAVNYFSNLKQKNKFTISLAQNTDEVKIFFQSDSTELDPEGIDSLTLKYTRTPHFISVACGYETFFDLKEILYSTQVIDTVIVSTALVSNDVNKENIKIVLKK